MDIKQKAAHCKADIQGFIQSYFNQLDNTHANPLYEVMLYATDGGKYIRSLMMVEAAKICGIHSDNIIPLAAGLEMIHAYSLIHDDLPAMDNDDMRRNKPSTHKKFNEAAAILAGDALQSHAFELASSPIMSINPINHLQVIHALGQAISTQGMAGGQMLDMAYNNQHITHDNILTMQQLKTGALFRFAVKAPAMLEGNDINITLFDELGLYLGALFQLTDDIIDATQEPGIAGKTTGKDKAQGKATIIEIEGLEATRYLATTYANKALSLVEHDSNKYTFFIDVINYLQNRKT